MPPVEILAKVEGWLEDEFGGSTTIPTSVMKAGRIRPGIYKTDDGSVVRIKLHGEQYWICFATVGEWIFAPAPWLRTQIKSWKRIQ